MSMAKANNGYLGVTEPISLGGPTEKDVVQAAEVEKYLEEASLYESQEGAVSREEVLGKLDKIVKSWIKKATRLSGYGEQFVQEANAKIFTFGSYRLGVHGPGADIDTLCVGPRHATRNEYFFRWLHEMLAEMTEVSELHPVPDAHVPVLGFKINGISIDLLYANLAHVVIPEDLDLSQDSILYNVDEQTVRSLNGCRVTDQILRLVPNIPSFRTTLRFIRYWGKRHGVYSNAIDEGKADWNSLFEAYPFFESYRNYLQVSITASNEDDLRNWKGWVESRLRTLVLKIERYTHEMIFARPYPRDFSDKSRPLHCFYFIGLWKKQTGQAQEAEQFDIRGIVNEFKTFIFASQNWKDGMDIEVSHVKRKEIPLFVFPDGVRPRSSRTKNKICHTVPKNDVSADGYVGNGSSNVNFSDAQPAPYESSYMKKTEPYSSGRCHLPGGISVLASRLPNKDALDGLVDCNTAPVQQEQAGHYHGNTSGPEKDVLCNVIHESNHMLPNSPNDLQTNEFGSFYKKSQRETSKNTANMFMNLSPAIPVAPDVLDEPASHEGTSNQKDDNVGQREFSDGYSEKSQGQTNTLNSHVYNHLKRKANEELEALELAAPVGAAPASASTAPRKPLRLRLTTLGK